MKERTAESLRHTSSALHQEKRPVFGLRDAKKHRFMEQDVRTGMSGHPSAAGCLITSSPQTNDDWQRLMSRITKSNGIM